ncbi:hypothetical protein PIB30_042186 [Stylosanthes scabra]|uniref:Uncharacterized protein n=1 Tax=Stylosanthes scabra TaxID=79078 RepID=A0ABU6TEW9_9FABA|nr:hypothetical protein [Stylosanthes scabra]
MGYAEEESRNPLYSQLPPPVPQGCSTALPPNQCRRVSTRHTLSTNVVPFPCVTASSNQSRTLPQRRPPFAQCRDPIMWNWVLIFQGSAVPIPHSIGFTVPRRNPTALLPHPKW